MPTAAIVDKYNTNTPVKSALAVVTANPNSTKSTLATTVANPNSTKSTLATTVANQKSTKNNALQGQHNK